MLASESKEICIDDMNYFFDTSIVMTQATTGVASVNSLDDRSKP